MPDKALEGGYIHIRKKVWKGIVRNKEENRILWTCNHFHYRPEFNARWQPDPMKEVYRVWEMSALNCGRAAYGQWDSGKVEGNIGDCGRVVRDSMYTPDRRSVDVDEYRYYGELHLMSSGQRVLRLHNRGVQRTLPVASLNLDVAPWTGVSYRDNVADQREHIYTALWALKGSLWGLMFHDYRHLITIPYPYQKAQDYFAKPESETKPRKKKTQQSPAKQEPKKPILDVEIVDGKRIYVVKNEIGEEQGRFFQRGKAAEAMKGLR